MVAWEVPLASPCEVSTIWITIIQWKIPCSMHKHTREVCKLIHLKVGNWEQIREVRRQKCWDKPQMQPYSWVLTVRLSRERGKIMLQLVLYSARGSKQTQWAFLQQWILGQEHSTEVQTQLSSGGNSRQRNKTPDPGCPLTSQSWPPSSLGAGLQSTLSANLRTGTTESLFARAKGTVCTVPGNRRIGVICRGLMSPLLEGKQLRRWPGYPSQHHLHASWLHWRQYLGILATLGFHGFGAPLLTAFFCRVGPLVLRWPDHIGCTHLPIFHHPLKIWKVRKVR